MATSVQKRVQFFNDLTKMDADCAESAVLFVKSSESKNLIENKEISVKSKSPDLTSIIGEADCSLCLDEDRLYMIKCCYCWAWFHFDCVGLGLEGMKWYVNSNASEKYPYWCVECRAFMDSRIGKHLMERVFPHFATCRRKCHKLVDDVDKLKKDVLLQESKLLLIENQMKYEEGLSFQEAVNRQIEKYIGAIGTNLNELEGKIEGYSHKNNSEIGNSYDRKKRIVIFGMPNRQNDLESVQLLMEELDIDRTNIKKIFRIKSKTNDSNIAPPINVEFFSYEERFKFLNKNVREKLKNLPEKSVFHGVSVAPDRSFRERQQFKQLKIIMTERNLELLGREIHDSKWIIRNMRLEKVEVKPGEA